MNEKLLENWLDNAGERSYQAVFAQMLTGQGYTVLHSTRHCALEYGKDVLAIAPDGIGCAFQLKGNPGARLTLDAFRREIQPQLVQLIAQPPSFPGFPPKGFRAYLVTNGNVDEEVQVAIAQMNTGPYLAKIELITRGLLLEWARRLGTATWPSELKDDLSLLQLYLTDPKDILPVQLLVKVLYPVLGLDLDRQPTEVRTPELERTASSAALLTGIATSRFAEAENHYACAQAWTVLCVSIIAAVEGRGHKWTRSLRETLALGRAAVLDCLVALWDEISGRETYVEGSLLSDPEIYGWRAGVLLGAMSSLLMAAEHDPMLLPQAQLDSLKGWLMSGKLRPQLWGEAAISYLVPWLLAMRKNDPTMRPDFEIFFVAKAVIAMNQPEQEAALAPPYCGIEEVLQRQIDEVTKGKSSTRELHAGRSYTAETLFGLLVRTNLKSRCKSLWPAYTKLSLIRFEWKEPWQYCLVRSRGGREVTRLPKPTTSWADLREEVLGKREAPIPSVLALDSLLLTLWWQTVPHRFSVPSCAQLLANYLPNWGR